MNEWSSGSAAETGKQILLSSRGRRLSTPVWWRQPARTNRGETVEKRRWGIAFVALCIAWMVVVLHRPAHADARTRAPGLHARRLGENGAHHQLGGSMPASTSARRAASSTSARVISLTNQHRWADLYSMMVPYIRHALSRSAFIQDLERASPSILSVRASGQGRFQSTHALPAGPGEQLAHALYVQPVVWRRLYRSSGKVASKRGYIALALLRNRWLVAMTQ